MTDLIRAPWTPEQVDTLNAFQERGGMHPFTCGRETHDVHLVLLAHRDGWHCSDPACDYRQDWAHAFMADPTKWPQPRQRFTARPVIPEMEQAATERARQAAADSERAAEWFAANGGILGKPADEPARTTPNNSPTPVRTHVWDGTRTLPDWLPADTYRWDNGQLVIRHPDGGTHVRAGWMLVHWTDGMVTVASPRIAERIHGPGGLVERAGRLAAAILRIQALVERHPDTIPTHLVEAALDQTAPTAATSPRAP